MRRVPVKPLTPSGADTLLERILHGEGAMLRSLVPLSPTAARLRMSVQDANRGFDWIDIVFEMQGIADARFLDDTKLAHVDTDEGITLVFDNGIWGIGVGRYSGIEALKSSPLYMVGTSLKYEEAPFGGQDAIA